MADEADKRSYRRALLVLSVGAVLLLVAFAMPWATVQLPLVAGATAGTRAHEFTGRDLLGGAGAAGWVCLAGVAGILATRSWGRILVGAIVVLAGLGAAAACIVFAIRPSGVIENATKALAGSSASISVATTPWWVLSLLGGAVAALAGAWTLRSGRRWPAMGSRYERSPRAASTTSAWDALDKGTDPTV